MLAEQIQEITSSAAFSQIPKDAYLCNVFVDDTGTSFGFYCVAENKIYTFSYPDIKVTDASEPVSPNLPRLTVTDTMLIAATALLKAKEHVAKEYSSEKPMKTFALLQDFKGKMVWQCIMLTQSLKSISMRFNVDTGALEDASCDDFVRMQ